MKWLRAIICYLFHSDVNVIVFYSNRTHRMRCLHCGGEWDD